MFRKSTLISLLLGFFLLIPKVSALVSPTREFYVNDYANVLSDETESYIMSYSPSIYSKSGIQVVVVTVNSLEGKDVNSYANELYRSFGIGNKEDNKGLLILISKGDRKYRIEVGYGLEGDFNDAKLGRMTSEYLLPYLREDDYNKGVLNFYKAFINELSNIYDLSITANPIKGNTSDSDEVDNVMVLLSAKFLEMMFLPFLFHLDKKKNKKWKTYLILFAIDIFTGYALSFDIVDWFIASPFAIIFNLLTVGLLFGSVKFISPGSGHGGSWSSGGGYSSGGGGGFSGGVGSSGGGGVSGSF